MYFVDNRRYDEIASTKLGAGSEGGVYPFPDDPSLCVKLFHPPIPGDADSVGVAKFRSRKIDAICKLRPTLALPERFTLPIKPAYDDNGNIVGFLMKKLVRFEKVKRLLDQQFRIENEVTLRNVFRFAADIFDDASLLHSRQLTIQDINAGFIMVDKVLRHALVDSDSWNYPGFSSLATTELFAHPDLYPNLMKRGGYVSALPHHDRFGLLLLFLLIALPGVHAFRVGAHSRYTSLQERCINGVTVFDHDVIYPSYLPPREVLSDDLLNEFIVRLKRKTNEPLKTDALRKFSEEVVVCPKCSAQYHQSRAECPLCHESALIQVVKKIEELFKTQGTILFTQVVGNMLRVACSVNNELHVATIDSQQRIRLVSSALDISKGARCRFFDSFVVICRDVYVEPPVVLEIYRIGDQKLRYVTSTTTGVLENSSALFDTSGSYLYRTAGNSLLCARFVGEMMLEEVVCEVHRSQTWLTVDRTSSGSREAIFGYDRALREFQWFVISGDHSGERFDYHPVALPMRVGEKLEDFNVYFNLKSVLLIRKTLYRGKEYVRYSVVLLSGEIEQDSLLGTGDQGFDLWRETAGKLYQSSSVLHLSPNGIVKNDLLAKTYISVDDTDVVMQGDRLLKFGKTLAIVRRTNVVAITTKKKT